MCANDLSFNLYVVAVDPHRPINIVTGAKKSYKETTPLFEPGHTTVRNYRDNIRSAHASLNKITGSNTTMNKELIKGLAMQYGMQMFDPNATLQASHMDVAIVDALADYYGVLRDGEKRRSRSNFNRIALDNLHNILALATKKGATQRGMALRMRQKGSGCRTLIKLGMERMALYEKTNLQKNLIRFRRGVRDDKLRPEWEEFARNFWTHDDVSRPSEISKKSIRNPNDHSDDTQYRLHYLYVSVGREYDMMIQAAKAQHEKYHNQHEALLKVANDKKGQPEYESFMKLAKQRKAQCDSFKFFHLSSTRNSELRPFFVKDACIDSCLCIYHLKFMQATLDLYNFRKALRQSKVCKCDTPLYRNSADLWHALLCPREEKSKVYPRQCVSNDCAECCGAGRLQRDVLCNCIGDHNTTRIEWKQYEQIDTLKTRIAREDGHESKVYRWDFKKQFTETDPNGTPIATFLEYFANDLWPEFVEHHDLAVWQDFDWQQQKKNMPLGACVTVEDFPENFTHLFKHEPQSAYWQQIQSGMYVLVAQFNLDECDNIDDKEKEELREVFNANGEPHFITESHIVISPDTQHGFAMVQHFREQMFTPYVKKNMPNVNRCWCRSDGCRAQYKGRHHFGFISSHGEPKHSLNCNMLMQCACRHSGK